MTEDKSNTHKPWPAAYLVIAVVVVAIPFLPLLCSGLEHLLFGSHYVEEFFQRIGLHSTLSRLYEPLLRFFHMIP